ncbi:Predicted ABC-type transport system involved in lysophospholipase L1 biosynthesis, permease component [gamma proteobacterium HdN1]|nr:Predicted ABC-type transport system involved in lysophospholipase L1 biosynthesis, permease component [gamma proteobacterium HdN1]
MSADARLALRLLWRDWRAGELRVLILALVIAVASTTLIQFFVERLHRGMVEKAADLMGGDLVIESAQPIPPAWWEHAQLEGVQRLQTVEFNTVATPAGTGAAATDELMQLVSVKAVQRQYPLRGSVRIADSEVNPENSEGVHALLQDRPARQGPEAGTLWVEPRVLSALSIKLGDRLHLGDAELKITRLLTFESDRGGSFYSFSPRILMSLDDVPATHVLQPGSRVTWRLLLAGDSEKIAAFQAWVTPQLSVHQQLQDLRKNRPELSGALVKAEDYLGLTSLMAVLLAGVAIAMAAHRYSLRHLDMSAMLRSLGASQARILVLYGWQFFALALIGSLLGSLIGWGGHFVLEMLLRASLPVRLPAPGWMPVLTGTGTAFIMLAGFALPPILRLRRVSPLRVLRRDALPPAPATWIVYGLAMVAMFFLMWLFTGKASLAALVFGGTLAVLLVFALLALLVLRLIQRLRNAGLAWRLGVRRLGQNPGSSVGQLVAFSLTLMIMLLLVMVRTDLLQHWQAQLPEHAPNHFAINILPTDQAAFQGFLEKHHLPHAEIYPMVRGRLTEINGVPVMDKLDEETRKSQEWNRELNLTWTWVFPEANRLRAGQWFQNREQNREQNNAQKAAQKIERADETLPQVSAETRFAERAGLRLGDIATFSIAGKNMRAQVSSFRDVQWDSFKPNFFFIFEPGALSEESATYMTSFYLSPEQKPLLNTLVLQFPSVSVLEIDAVLTQVRGILMQVIAAVEYMLLFALAAGVVVLWAAVQTTLTERLQEGALLRVLGAERKVLQNAQRVEFIGIGALSGLLAVGGAELVLWVLYREVFHLEFSINPWAWWLVPLIGILLVGGAGLRSVRKVVKTPPQIVLRNL